MNNQKYGKSISDDMFLEILAGKMQMRIDFEKNENCMEYSEDGIKTLVLDELDSQEIYPEDIDFIFSQLDF